VLCLEVLGGVKFTKKPYPNNKYKYKYKIFKVKSKPLELRSRVKKVIVQMLSKCQYRKTGP
jgi:hypothetical protein